MKIPSLHLLYIFKVMTKIDIFLIKMCGMKNESDTYTSRCPYFMEQYSPHEIIITV